MRLSGARVESPQKLEGGRQREDTACLQHGGDSSSIFLHKPGATGPLGRILTGLSSAGNCFSFEVAFICLRSNAKGSGENTVEADKQQTAKTVQRSNPAQQPNDETKTEHRSLKWILSMHISAEVASTLLTSGLS